jgi:hypothetical protein
MKQIFLVAALCCTALVSFAQQAFTDSLRQATSQEERKRWNLYRNELCFTVDNLLLGGGSGSTILFKRRYESGKLIRVKRTQALRAFVSLDIDQSLGKETPDNIDLTNRQRSDNYAAVGVGKEIQENLGRFQFFYGLDVFASFQNYKVIERAYFVDPGTSTLYAQEHHRSNRDLRGGVTPFAGLRFFVHPRISFAFESGLAVAFSQHVERFEARDELLNFERVSEDKGKSIHANVLAKRFFTLNFHF